MTSLPALRLPTENAIPTTPFCEPWLTNLRRGMGWVAGRPALMANFSISPEQARGIKARRSTLARQTTAGASDRQAIGVELAKLLAAFPAQDAGVSTALRIEAYSDALGDAPAWAVHEARLMVVRGEAPDLDKRFAPTPPQLADLVRDILRPLKNDLADLAALETIGSTSEPDEAERARVAAGLASLKADLRPPVPNWQDKPEAGLQARAQALGADFKTVFDAIPDAPERTGTFARPSMPPEPAQ